MRWTIAAFLLGFAVAASAGDIGQIKTLSGAVHIERDGGQLPAAVGMPVRERDRLVTGADGALGVTFIDNSLLSIGPDSTLALDKYVFNSTTHDGQFDASLNRGSLAVVSGDIVKQSPEAMHVHTPSSIMGVRGTDFLVRVLPAGD
ncbi:MAG TPA: FecR domain-containing protein [Burkholderiales bacterium]|nr:FecR domain-containing protein [Burkholderiales bacterium]